MIFFIVLLGLAVGSFVNVCIYRIPQSISVISPRSFCPYCRTQLMWKDLLPVVSYFQLHAKCRYCACDISLMYPIIELLNCAAYILIFSVFGLSLNFVGFALLTSALIVAAVIDFNFGVIPNKLIFTVGIAGLLFSLLNLPNFTNYIIGFFAASVPLLLLSIAFGGGMGGGDIKLTAVAGLFLGWKLIILSVFAASFLGCAVAFVLMLRGKKNLKDSIVFGPFLAVGIFACIIWGKFL